MNDLFYECSYLDLISPNDNKNNSYDQYLNVNLFTLFTNCDKNKNNSNISHNISKNISNNHNFTKFKELITKINETVKFLRCFLFLSKEITKSSKLSSDIFLILN